MANRTINLPIENFGYIFSGEPYETHPVSGNTWWNVAHPWGSGIRALYVQFAQMPAALKRKALKGLSITIRARCKTDSTYKNADLVGIFRLKNQGDTFDPSTITYANAPQLEDNRLKIQGISGGTTTVTQEYTIPLIQESEVLTGDVFAKNRILAFSATDYDSRIVFTEISTRLADGSMPYVTVTYDDAVDVEPSMYMIESIYKHDPTCEIRLAEMTFRFGGQAVQKCADNVWNVSSADFYYRMLGSSSAFTHVHVEAADLGGSGTVRNYVTPPYTFSAGRTYEWYVIITDTDGGEWTPNEVWTGDEFRTDTTAEFTTSDLYLTLRSFPSGTINNAFGSFLSWTLKTENNYDVIQTSAVFHWKADGEGSYHSITVSGDTKELTVPAYTFPAGKTITYYLAVTGAGYTAFSETKTFKTYGYSLQVSEYPQGNKVCPGNVLSFTYTLQTTTGTDVRVTSSTLYWRESTSGSYAAITNTGSEKAVHVPANTIPTGISVQWYLEATAADGTVMTTSPKNFTTATSKITPQDSPTDGYMDPRNAITFSWFLAAGSGSVAQTAASLFWKLSTAQSYTEVQAGTDNSITIAANTFPVAGLIDWYLTGTDYSGNSSQTQVFQFSTTASTAYATCISPVGRVEDGTKPITFRWDVANEDGTEPSRVALYWKLDTESEAQWKTLLDVNEAVYTYTAPEGTFTAGAIEWKVAAWNRDGVKGPENQASFVCLMAPPEPSGLRATAVPRTTISWQSSGQEAYEIRIDGVVEALEYSPAVSSWQREEPLPDGVHSIEVRIQGAYGLWSNPAVTSIDVVNVPVTTITLTCDFGVDALLSWEYGGTVTDPEPNVYRDGVRIAELKDVLEFTDRLVLGEHEYYVTLWDETGNYSISNIVTGKLESKTPRICGADGGEWIELRLTEDSDGAEDFQWSRNYALHNVRGSSFPVLETGSFETLIGNYSCAFADQREAVKLEELRGKLVIMKTRRGNVIQGALLQLQKQVRLFYTVYSFSLQQLHWEDFIRDENR